MLERPAALQLIDAAFADQPLVLTLGGTIRAMLAMVGQKPNHLYCLDAMGQPLAIGLGLALGVSQRVVVVEGDGSLLMGFSAVATVGHLKPRNLVAVVLDNGVYLATGGQSLRRRRWTLGSTWVRRRSSPAGASSSSTRVSMCS
jgi:sulfopyruvate decarboxylase subunit beta